MADPQYMIIIIMNPIDISTIIMVMTWSYPNMADTIYINTGCHDSWAMSFVIETSKRLFEGTCPSILMSSLFHSKGKTTSPTLIGPDKKWISADFLV